MRIHHLRATAFGPFPDEVSVDFDELTAAGLFLIHGPTGAGKTSLLDAICFALFADVPGLRDKRGIVSDHAAPSAVPSVELEFTCGTRRFILRRSPAHLRAKKRGTGTIETPATVALSEHLDGEWVVVSTRNDETAEVLHDVLGMGKEQFAKVAMLPQGEFAAFLTAKDDERRALLEKLFDITRFADVEEWLVDARRSSEATVAGLRAGIDTDLARLADVVARSTASGEDESHAGASDDAAGSDERLLEGLPALDPDSPDAIRGLLETMATRIEVTLSEAMVRLDAASSADVAAASAFQDGRSVQSLRERASAARVSLGALESAQDEIARARSVHDRATRAGSVRGDLAAVERARAEVHRRQASVAEAHAAVSRLVTTGFDSSDTAVGDSAVPRTALPDSGLVDKDRGTDRVDAEVVHGRSPEALVRVLRQHDDNLRELLRLDAERTARARRAREQLRDMEAATSVLQSAAERRTTASDRVEAATAAVTASLDATTSLAGLEQAAAEARSRVDLARRTLDDGALLDRLVRESADARSRAQDARDHELDLVARRLSQMAAELAERLVDGEACSVCGATAHPSPAQGGRQVTEAELDAARVAHADLVAAHHECEVRVTTTRTRIEEALRQLAVASVEELDLDAFEFGSVEATRRHDTARALAAEHAQRTAHLDAARAALTALEDSVAAARHELTRVSAMAEQTREDEESARVAMSALWISHADCPCGSTSAAESSDNAARTEAHAADSEPFPGSDAVAELASRHRAAVDSAAAWAEAVARHAETAERLKAALDAGLIAVTDAGFESFSEATDAVLPSGELQRIGDRLRDHDRARAGALSVLHDPMVMAAEEALPPDLALLEREAVAARSALLAAKSAQTEAAGAQRSFRAIRSSLTAGLDAAGPALAHHHRVKDLADTFSGGGLNNTLRMRLTSYVLAARLDKVARLANERLRIMGDGRYSLEHSDRLAARGARSGLGLRVLDQWTGVSRETSTLSGGEAFMASLALALGLADAVREESGGFDLGTLFVDEGFGTLDDESLEQVISVLDSLREGGRAVGVVSHVGELRSRITHQLVVRKTASGSTVAIAGPGSESAA
ncbi:AAA family ATPase [Knoellia subterranea]|uniref:Nuclease SbcCD subunit C n=1 Tax=Knoellia subterranea KCTC 19937 TaxID=1385521 RepID=A0A0A0JT91_9MICO|nr:SMC family ATPase [Knoellia subterranea]KGN38866.1 hypothetical protein N803_07855 [Knoellia subterranea KCTC 19937]